MPCESTPADGMVNNYTASQCSCSFCAASCTAPPVNDVIGFLDGFNGKLVGYSYIGFFAFTILYQLALYFVCKRKTSSNIDSTISASKLNVNNTVASGNISSNYNSVRSS